MENVSPKISVIVPVYNVEQYLPKCIDSILAQTFTDFELLLIDDGSPDNSGAICDEYARKDPRIRVYHEENGGVSSARNLGIENAKGCWLSFIDADDWVEHNYLSAFVDITKSVQVDMVVSSQYIDGDKLIHIDEIVLSSEEARNQLLKFNGFPTSLCMSLYRREVLNDLSLSTEIHHWEDFEFQYRALMNSSFIGISNTPTYHYFMRDGSANHSEINEKILSCMRIPDKMNADGQITDSQKKDIYAFFIFQCFMKYVQSKNPATRYSSEISSYIIKGWKAIALCNVLKWKQKIAMFSFLVFPRYVYEILHSKY